MERVTRQWSFFSLGMAMLVLFPPAEGMRTSHFHHQHHFRTAPLFHNHHQCGSPSPTSNPCSHTSLIHVAITLDVSYLRGSIAAVHSLLRHSSCPDHLFLHFLTSPPDAPRLSLVVRSTFPSLHFRLYPFDSSRVRRLISPSIRPALDQPLNYARNYLADLLPQCVHRVVYLDSDLVVVDDVASLWSHPLGSYPLGAPEYCHANFSSYFTPRFWSNSALSGTFLRRGRPPCYFNTGVMVIDLERWRRSGYTSMLERWMEVQKEEVIYELGSLPPFLLVFAGRVAAIDHRWNQHGLGGDNVKGSCRELHPGPVSLLHWSGSGKPWARLDAGKPCPLDALWKPYDLYALPTPEKTTTAQVHPR